MRSSYDDSDSKFDKYLDDDKALSKVTRKLMSGRDGGLNLSYSMYKKEEYTENELAPSMKRHKIYNMGNQDAKY